METLSSPDGFFLGVISTFVLQESKKKKKKKVGYTVNWVIRSEFSFGSCCKGGLMSNTYASVLIGLRVSSSVKNSRASKSLFLW